MAEQTVSLSNDSRLVDDIERIYKHVAYMSECIRDILTTGIGGNPVPLYVEFRKEFSFLYSMTSDHKEIVEKPVNRYIVAWRDTPGLTIQSIFTGLKLFEQYKTELFRSKLLRYS